jgi:Predicted transporter component
MKVLTAFVAGLLFGGGLLLSRMADPQVVLGFLDVAGHWNPALVFVMGGAILVGAPAFFLMRRRACTLAGEPVTLPDRTRIDGALVLGAAIFGLGWGMSGICPGPGLVLLGGLTVQAFTFVAAMLVGLLVAGRLQRTQK